MAGDLTVTVKLIAEGSDQFSGLMFELQILV